MARKSGTAGRCVQPVVRHVKGLPSRRAPGRCIKALQVPNTLTYDPAASIAALAFAGQGSPRRPAGKGRTDGNRTPGADSRPV